jgi:hypothetical protein
MASFGPVTGRCPRRGSLSLGRTIRDMDPSVGRKPWYCILREAPAPAIPCQKSVRYCASHVPPPPRQGPGLPARKLRWRKPAPRLPFGGEGSAGGRSEPVRGKPPFRLRGPSGAELFAGRCRNRGQPWRGWPVPARLSRGASPNSLEEALLENGFPWKSGHDSSHIASRAGSDRRRAGASRRRGERQKFLRHERAKIQSPRTRTGAQVLQGLLPRRGCQWASVPEREGMKMTAPSRAAPTARYSREAEDFPR